MTDDDEPIREDDGYSLVSQPGEDKAEKKREEAFNAGYNWHGETFDGLSSSRKDLWIALCHKCGFPPIIAGKEDLQWFVPSAKALVFICILPKAKIKKLHALGIERVQSEFIDWVDENVAIREESDIVDLGFKLWTDSGENQAEAVPTGGPGK